MQFELGLTFTGTVSAGAYTAGVIDFIIDALDEWQKEKDASKLEFGDDDDGHSKWTVPWHDVVIKGLSGASGGGVSCGLILNSVGKQYGHVRTPADAEGTDNDFYNAWVNMLGIEQLLATDDIAGSDIKSLLNCNAIPRLADQLLVKANFGNTFIRPFIDDNLIAILTLTNLRGIPYVLQHKAILSESIVYYRHTDYAKFKLTNTDDDPNEDLDKDAIVIPLDTNSASFDKAYAQLKAACLCTCAFPAAFKAQPFTQQTDAYNNRPDAIALDPITNPEYSFLSSDGGVLNTEPFQVLHDAFPKLSDSGQNPRGPEDVVRAIIMVAPLETSAVFDQAEPDLTKDSLVNIVIPVINSIRQEALFSAEQIALAFNESVFSRFMIAPVRNPSATTGNLLTPAITGTVLGDFAAFLSKDFRQHDYFLGRRNAQQFLRFHFAVPVDKVTNNPVFGPMKIRGQFDKFIFTDIDTEPQVDYFPIIPLCGAVKEDAFFPEWPTGKGFSIDTIQNMVKDRVTALVNASASSLNLGTIEEIIASIILSRLKNALTSKLMDVINNGLNDVKLQ